MRKRTSTIAPANGGAARQQNAFEIEALGDSGLIVRLPAVAKASWSATDEVLAACGRLRTAAIRGLVEIAPACTTIGIFYDPARVELNSPDELPFAAITSQVAAALGRRGTRRPFARARMVEIPVCYAPEFGIDLLEVAQQAGLSAAEVVSRHSAASYRVACVGFTAGFPYLVGLPEELTTPRRDTPRKQVAAGSVAIGGAQTGIYPAAAPGGWNVIGRTPSPLFDVQQSPPALLQPGDEVRFRAITRAEFDRLAR